MRKLDDTIGIVAYILDTLIAYRNITALGNCNDCGKKKDCEYLPQCGEQVRYNCPFFEREVTE